MSAAVDRSTLGTAFLDQSLAERASLARTGTPRPLLLTTPPGGAGPYWDQGGGQPDRQPGGLYDLGDACVAPTKTCSRQDRYGVPGRSIGAVAFVLRDLDDRRSSARICVIPGFPFSVNSSQQSRSVIANLEVFTSWATHAVRYQDILYTSGVKGHLPWGGRYALESDRSAGTEASPLQRHAWPLQGRYSVPERSMGAVSFARVTSTIGDHLRKSAVWRSHLSEIHGQQSRSIIANLEVFTTWATQASPLHRYAPTGPVRRALGRSMGAVSFVLRDLDDRRSSARICGSVFPVSGVFTVNNRGRWAFTWRSLPTGRRRRRPYTDLSTPRRLGCPRRRPFRSSAGRHRHNLRHLRFDGRGVGVVGVNIRGRWWFPWRCLPTGRRRRRPYTDLSTPPRLDASHWYPFRSSAGRHRHNL